MSSLHPSRFVLFLVLVVIATVGGCTNDDPVGPGSGSLIGSAMDAATHLAVHSVRIQTLPASQSVLTDSAGTFTMTGVTAGSYSVIASRTGYTSDTVVVQITAGGTARADFLLERQVGGDNHAPYEPRDPSPVIDGQTIGTKVVLSWTDAGDPDNDTVTFEVKLKAPGGSERTIASNMSGAFLNVSSLDKDTRYEWRVIAEDSRGLATSSKTWSFTTGSVLQPNAMLFTGDGSYSGNDAGIRFDEHFDFSFVSSYTIEAWIHPRAFEPLAWHWIAAKGASNADAELLFGVVNRRLYLQTRREATKVFASKVLDTGDWYHVAAVQDGDGAVIRLYVDGELVGSGALTGAPHESLSNFFIGARENSGANTPCEAFEGTIHEVRLWDHARTRDQIVVASRQRVGSRQPGLVSSWPLDEGEGLSVRDVTARHSGTILGSASWMHSELPIN